MRDDLVHLPQAPTTSPYYEEAPSLDEVEGRDAFWSLQETAPSESSLLLVEVLRELDRPAQLILELHYVKGLTIAQTAYVMERSRHEVEEIRLRVLKTLQRAFAVRLQQEYT